MDLITTIIPIYNAEKYLANCIESILAQSYEELEILLIDDGSKDSSAQISLEYEKKDSRVKYFYQNNSGVSVARMNGVKYSSSDFIMFVDADDYLDKDCLINLKKIIDEKKVDIACCGSQDWNSDGCCNTYSYEDELISDKEKMLSDYFLHDKRYMCTLWGKLYKKSVFKDIVFPKLRYGEDTLLNHMLYQRVNSIFLTSYIGYNYRLFPLSASNTISEYKKNLDLIVRDAYIYDICDEMGTEFIDIAKKRLIVRISQYINSALSMRKEAIKDYPSVQKNIDKILKFRRLPVKYRMKICIYKFYINGLMLLGVCRQ